MSQPAPQPGQPIDLCPPGVEVTAVAPGKLVKTAGLEVVRLVLPAGKQIPTHHAPGPITVHCLAGHIAFTVGEHTCQLTPGQLLYLEAQVPHSLQALADSLVLVTIAVPPA